MPARRRKPAEPKGPSSQVVQLSPPAYRIREKAGLGLPTGRQLAESVSGVIGGALISAVFITAMQGNSKWVGAILTTGLGGVLTTTSPIGTIPQEFGMGMLATSLGWAYFDVSGQFVQPSTAGQQGGVAAPPMVLPRANRQSA